MKIEKNETKIIGHWIFDGTRMIADDQCKRIDWLRNGYLQLITTDESGWLNLYRDSEDGRYWQLQFEHGGMMHGGGPPSLIMISEQEARAQYQF